MRARWIMVLGLLALLGLGALAVRPARCRLAVAFVRREPADLLDAADRPLDLVTLSVRNRDSLPLVFDDQRAVVEARLGRRWVRTENVWSNQRLERAGLPASTREVLLALPRVADGCRVRLPATHVDTLGDHLRRLFGIGWPEPPTMFAYRLQQAVHWAGPSWVYYSLWPTNWPGPSTRRWQSITAAADLPPALGGAPGPPPR